MDYPVPRYPAPTEDSPVKSSISIFLSLFLLILAFFILMVSISTFEEVKSKAVMNSLSSTFATVLPPSGDPTEFTAKEGDIIAGQQFQDQISEIFSAAMQVAKVEIVQPGKTMHVAFPVESMFAREDAALRPVAIPLLDRIIAALSGSPPGLKFEMEFVVGTGKDMTKPLPTTQSLALSRAGTFAREMANRGVPPGRVSVGVEPADPTRVGLWFFVRAQPQPPAAGRPASGPAYPNGARPN